MKISGNKADYPKEIDLPRKVIVQPATLTRERRVVDSGYSDRVFNKLEIKKWFVTRPQ